MLYQKYQSKFWHKAIASFLILGFSLSLFAMYFSKAGAYYHNPLDGSLTNLLETQKYKISYQSMQPPLLTGIELDRKDPLILHFYINNQNRYKIKDLEVSRLVRYFLGFLAVSEDKYWVNLSPYEDKRIIPQDLAKLDIGKDLLIEDYILKQLTASLTSFNTKKGEKIWDKLKVITLNNRLPVDLVHKIWIVPDKALVWDNGNSFFVKEARLKLMLEEDYLAYSKDKSIKSSSPLYAKRYTLNAKIKEILKKELLPIMEKEVNEGKNFAALRQMYYALILAVKFKEKLFKHYIYRYYIDSNKTKPINLVDINIKDKVYAAYLTSFKQSVYNNLVKEYDKYSRRKILKHYYSGGFSGVEGSKIITTTNQPPSETSYNKYTCQLSNGSKQLSEKAEIKTLYCLPNVFILLNALIAKLTIKKKKNYDYFDFSQEEIKPTRSVDISAGAINDPIHDLFASNKIITKEDIDESSPDFLWPHQLPVAASLSGGNIGQAKIVNIQDKEYIVKKVGRINSGFSQHHGDELFTRIVLASLKSKDFKAPRGCLYNFERNWYLVTEKVLAQADFNKCMNLESSKRQDLALLTMLTGYYDTNSNNLLFADNDSQLAYLIDFDVNNLNEEFRPNNFLNRFNTGWAPYLLNPYVLSRRQEIISSDPNDYSKAIDQNQALLLELEPKIEDLLSKRQGLIKLVENNLTKAGFGSTDTSYFKDILENNLLNLRKNLNQRIKAANKLIKKIQQLKFKEGYQDSEIKKYISLYISGMPERNIRKSLNIQLSLRKRWYFFYSEIKDNLIVSQKFLKTKLEATLKIWQDLKPKPVPAKGFKVINPQIKKQPVNIAVVEKLQQRGQRVKILLEKIKTNIISFDYTSNQNIWPILLQDYHDHYSKDLTLSKFYEIVINSFLDQAEAILAKVEENDFVNLIRLGLEGLLNTYDLKGKVDYIRAFFSTIGNKFAKIDSKYKSVMLSLYPLAFFSLKVITKDGYNEIATDIILNHSQQLLTTDYPPFIDIITARLKEGNLTLRYLHDFLTKLSKKIIKDNNFSAYNEQLLEFYLLALDRINDLNPHFQGNLYTSLVNNYFTVADSLADNQRDALFIKLDKILYQWINKTNDLEILRDMVSCYVKLYGVISSSQQKLAFQRFLFINKKMDSNLNYNENTEKIRFYRKIISDYQGLMKSAKDIDNNEDIYSSASIWFEKAAQAAIDIGRKDERFYESLASEYEELLLGVNSLSRNNSLMAFLRQVVFSSTYSQLTLESKLKHLLVLAGEYINKLGDREHTLLKQDDIEELVLFIFDKIIALDQESHRNYEGVFFEYLLRKTFTLLGNKSFSSSKIKAKIAQFIEVISLRFIHSKTTNFNYLDKYINFLFKQLKTIEDKDKTIWVGILNPVLEDFVNRLRVKTLAAKSPIMPLTWYDSIAYDCLDISENLEDTQKNNLLGLAQDLLELGIRRASKDQTINNSELIVNCLWDSCSLDELLGQLDKAKPKIRQLDKLIGDNISQDFNLRKTYELNQAILAWLSKISSREDKTRFFENQGFFQEEELKTRLTKHKIDGLLHLYFIAAEEEKLGIIEQLQKLILANSQIMPFYIGSLLAQSSLLQLKPQEAIFNFLANLLKSENISSQIKKELISSLYSEASALSNVSRELKRKLWLIKQYSDFYPFEIIELGEGGEAPVFQLKTEGSEYALKLFFNYERYENTVDVLKKFYKKTKDQIKDRQYFINVIDPAVIVSDEQDEHKGNPDDRYYGLTMETITQAKTLDSLIKEDSLSLSEKYEIIYQIIQGVKVLHKYNILHRDLKPSNIFICKNQTNNTLEVKIFDFGFAIDLDNPNPQDNGGGTANFIYPLCTDMTKGNSPRRDIFSIGSIALELFLGKQMQDNPTMSLPWMTGVGKLIFDKFREVKQSLKDLDPDMNQFIWSMLSPVKEEQADLWEIDLSINAEPLVDNFGFYSSLGDLDQAFNLIRMEFKAKAFTQDEGICIANYGRRINSYPRYINAQDLAKEIVTDFYNNQLNLEETKRMLIAIKKRGRDQEWNELFEDLISQFFSYGCELICPDLSSLQDSKALESLINGSKLLLSYELLNDGTNNIGNLQYRREEVFKRLINSVLRFPNQIDKILLYIAREVVNHPEDIVGSQKNNNQQIINSLFMVLEGIITDKPDNSRIKCLYYNLFLVINTQETITLNLFLNSPEILISEIVSKIYSNQLTSQELSQILIILKMRKPSVWHDLEDSLLSKLINQVCQVVLDKSDLEQETQYKECLRESILVLLSYDILSLNNGRQFDDAMLSQLRREIIQKTVAIFLGYFRETDKILLDIIKDIIENNKNNDIRGNNRINKQIISPVFFYEAIEEYIIANSQQKRVCPLYYKMLLLLEDTESWMRLNILKNRAPKRDSGPNPWARGYRSFLRTILSQKNKIEDIILLEENNQKYQVIFANGQTKLYEGSWTGNIYKVIEIKDSAEVLLTKYGLFDMVNEALKIQEKLNEAKLSFFSTQVVNRQQKFIQQMARQLANSKKKITLEEVDKLLNFLVTHQRYKILMINEEDDTIEGRDYCKELAKAWLMTSLDDKIYFNNFPQLLGGIIQLYFKYAYHEPVLKEAILNKIGVLLANKEVVDLSEQTANQLMKIVLEGINFDRSFIPTNKPQGTNTISVSSAIIESSLIAQAWGKDKFQNVNKLTLDLIVKVLKILPQEESGELINYYYNHYVLLSYDEGAKRNAAIFFLLGKLLTKYKFVDSITLLGSGGEGIVYQVAIKGEPGEYIFKIYIQGIGEKALSFQREKICYEIGLKEPRIISGNIMAQYVPDLTFDLEKGFAMLGLKAVRNEGDLHEFTRDKVTASKVGIERKLDIADSLLAGLINLLEGNIIHRDIKAENVLLNNDKIIIIDFGLGMDKKRYLNDSEYKSLFPEDLAGTQTYAPNYFMLSQDDPDKDWVAAGEIIRELIMGYEVEKNEQGQEQIIRRGFKFYTSQTMSGNKSYIGLGEMIDPGNLYYGLMEKLANIDNLPDKTLSNLDVASKKAIKDKLNEFSRLLWYMYYPLWQDRIGKEVRIIKDKPRPIDIEEAKNAKLVLLEQSECKAYGVEIPKTEAYSRNARDRISMAKKSQKSFYTVARARAFYQRFKEIKEEINNLVKQAKKINLDSANQGPKTQFMPRQTRYIPKKTIANQDIPTLVGVGQGNKGGIDISENLLNIENEYSNDSFIMPKESPEASNCQYFASNNFQGWDFKIIKKEEGKNLSLLLS